MLQYHDFCTYGASAPILVSSDKLLQNDLQWFVSPQMQLSSVPLTLWIKIGLKTCSDKMKTVYMIVEKTPGLDINRLAAFAFAPFIFQCIMQQNLGYSPWSRKVISEIQREQHIARWMSKEKGGPSST